jgi:hypothetical protein
VYNATNCVRFLVEGVPAMSSSTVNLSATLILDSSPERLWTLLSDTGRIDRAMGIPAFERSRLEPDLSFTVNSHYLSVPVAWREYPYEWVFEQWYQVSRVFLPPLPIEQVVNRTTLTALPGAGRQNPGRCFGRGRAARADRLAGGTAVYRPEAAERPDANLPLVWRVGPGGCAGGPTAGA